MSPQPYVSVVIATYNRAHLVGETLDSVLAQDDPDFEIVVVDDGSTDDTERVVAAYGDRVRYIKKENGGVSTAWNRGIEASRGKVVSFLASDDLWEPETISRARAALDAHPEAGLVSIMAREITPDGKRTSSVYGKKSPGEWYSTVSLLTRDAGGCSWFFIRREVLDESGWYDPELRTAEDCDILLRISFVTKMFALREPLLLRRMHEGNLTHDRLNNARQWLTILDKLAREHPEFVEAEPKVFKRALAKEWLRYGRELLAAERIDEAKEALSKSLAVKPLSRRAWTYWLLSRLAPKRYGALRRRELELRARQRLER